jgi:hypothetical protein
MDDKKLKGEWMHLLLEKDMYKKMIINLSELGNKVNWEPETLRKIKPMIDEVREQLTSKGKSSQVEKRE